MAKVRSKVLVKGIVQGVNFRYYTQRQAIRCNVSGWVGTSPMGLWRPSSKGTNRMWRLWSSGAVMGRRPPMSPS